MTPAPAIPVTPRGDVLYTPEKPPVIMFTPIYGQPVPVVTIDNSERMK